MSEVARISEPRIPYHPLVEERFGIDRAGWRALIDAVWPAAHTTDAVVLALSYCKARNLDPFKRPVHIVPVYSTDLKRYVESVWPGIGELRTTAFRTGLYAGRDKTEFGPDRELKCDDGSVVTYPEWAQVTVYRMCGTERRAYAGPQVFWIEAYAPATRQTIAPNAMWRRRPRGQLDKCAEAAALRAAFPEEGGDLTDDEMAGQVVEHAPQSELAEPERPPRGNAGLRAAILPERATAVDPEPKPPEAAAGMADDGAGSSSEADPAERRSGSATTRPRRPGDTGKVGRADEAGGSPVTDEPARDPFWAGQTLAIEPMLMKRSNRPDWAATHRLLMQRIGEVRIEDELTRLQRDSKRTLDGLKLAYVALYDEAVEAIAKARDDLLAQG